METTLRTRIARKLAHNTLIVGALITLGVAGVATQETVQQENPAGVVECWNPHTAQVTVETGNQCPAPVNPYAAR